MQTFTVQNHERGLRIKTSFLLFQDILKCSVCDMETSAAHTCIKCDKYIHVLCGTSCEEGCYVRIARLIPTEFVIVQGPWTVN